MHYHLTETRQKEAGYKYAIGPYSEPVVSVEPGDSVAVDTLDCFEGTVISETTLPSWAAKKIPFQNPQNGPIYVKSAMPGDALAVYIESIAPRGPQPRGTSAFQKYFGFLSHASKALNAPLPEIVRKFDVTENEVAFSKDLKLPYEPFIGTIGTSHLIYSVDTLAPSSHGGNMDLPDVAPGATLYLPVRVEGAYLHLGDCHAIQGDGEICGVAVEFPTTTTIKVDVIRGWSIEWPLLENERFIMATGSVRPLEDAVRLAYDNLILWMVEKYHFNRWDAYFLLTQAGRLRIGNVVDPNFIVGASILKNTLFHPATASIRNNSTIARKGKV